MVGRFDYLRLGKSPLHPFEQSVARKKSKHPYEAYSWGVGEDESGDGLYCGFEGVVGAAVIGV